MSSNIFDIDALNDFDKKLINIAQNDFPKDVKKFLRKENTQLKKVTKKNAKRAKKKTGQYYKSIKAGKVYKYGGSYAVRTYSADPKAHLLENGHRQVLNPGEPGKVANINTQYAQGVKKGKGIGKEIGFVPGLHIFEDSKKQFEDKFIEDIENFTGELLEKGLK